MPYLFRIRAGASLTVEDSSFTDIHNYERQCSRPAIVADAQASFTLRNSRIDSAWIDDSLANPLFSSALIVSSGQGAATITIENSTVTLAESGFVDRKLSFAHAAPASFELATCL